MNKFAAATIAATLALPAITAAQTPTAATYVMKAGASDLYERTSSQVVLQSTANPKLKSFANMMVTDHGKSTADVKAAAMAAKLNPAPPKLNADQTRMVAQLRAAKGTARDTLYLQQQKTAHGQALALQQDYAANGTVPSLKMAAGKIVPVVQHHIEMLDAM